MPRRLALLLLLPFALAAPAFAGAGQSAGPWLYRDSDIPPDPAWTFGELVNGLRYAVRRNNVPPGQVSIRVAIDAGSLAERPGEAGYAHFNEHLAFRGSAFVADGEAKRVWQRLGATFGSDTNASTTPTQTIYKLDLPAATPEALEESVKILSGMMAGPLITQASVDTERRTLLAEQRERSGPAQRVSDARRRLFFAGQKLGAGGQEETSASIARADATGLRAFHDRWYRPSRAVVVIVGDRDPAVFSALIEKYFSGWSGIGPESADPDFGDPKADAPRTRAVVENGLPPLVTLAALRPWRPRADTVEYNRRRQIDTIALRVLNRRLERRARRGASYLSASLDQDEPARSVDGTFVSIVPLGADWRAAVRDVRAAIADSLAQPPTQDEIDREAGEFTAGLDVAVERDKLDPTREIADTLVEAVNIRETVASAEVARDVFAGMGPRLTPAAMQASMRRLMSGAPLRALLTLPAADRNAGAELARAVAAPLKPGTLEAPPPALAFDRLPAFGPPGTVVRQGTIGNESIHGYVLSNGVRVVMRPTDGEPGRVLISVRFGRGVRALPTDAPSVAWAADAALVESGIGDLGQEELDRLTSGRLLGMDFAIAEDAFILAGQTRAADLPDELRLLAAKLAFPGWDPAPVLRARGAQAAGLAGENASPQAAIARALPRWLHGGDPRWTAPDRTAIEALTPERFRKLWEPLLASGPIEVSIHGDFKVDQALPIVLATFGAMPARAPAPVNPQAGTSAGVPPMARPIVVRHRGPADQAAAVLAWPTAGGLDRVGESRRLDLLADIFADRLFDQLREGEGQAYSPSVDSSWPLGLGGGGSFVVTAQLKPASVPGFYKLAKDIAADLAAHPVSADELTRVTAPVAQRLARMSTGSAFWMTQLGGVTYDRRRLFALASLSDDYDKVTPAQLQETAKRWLVPERSFAMVALPAK